MIVLPSCWWSRFISTRRSARQFRVEVRERLIEEKHVHIPHQRPPNCNALALATRERARLSLEERFNLEDLGRPVHALADLVPCHSGVSQTKGQVSLDRHLRVERVGLEDHPDAALRRLFPGNILILNKDLSVRDLQ